MPGVDSMEPANGQRLDRETIQSCVKVLSQLSSGSGNSNQVFSLAVHTPRY